MIHININIQLLQTKKKKRFLLYCPKLYEARLEAGTLYFLTDVLTNDAIDYLWILRFLFWMHSVYWTYRLFSDIFMYIIDIF